MDLQSAIKNLQLFNEKADKLEGLSFIKGLEKSGVTISWKLGQPIQAERHGPSDESIDAFVLTMRFFVQDNESTSFRNMADLYAELPIDSELVKKFNYARDDTNATLDKATPIRPNNFDLTWRETFEVFLWGGLAHANPKKKAVYDSWAKDSILFPLVQNEFVFALGILLNMIFYTRALNRAALAQLEKKSDPKG
jgi:hypothetical protein